MNKLLYAFLFTFVFSLAFINLSYAAGFEDYPEIPVVNDYQQYLIYQQGADTRLAILSSDNPFKVNSYVQSDGTIRAHCVDTNGVDAVDDIKVGIYLFRDDTWKITQEYTSYLTSFNANLFASTFNVYTDDTYSEIFFQGPPTHLYQIIQKMTAEEMTKTQITLAGVMRILLLCGVGCLALLMVFPLFGKVSKTFHLR